VDRSRLAATQPTQKDFLANVPALKSASASTPSSPFVELLIARLKRDDLDLGRRKPQSPELDPQRRASWMTFARYAAT
jgi:hypothetical protein